MIMKKMRRILTLALALMMLLSLAAPVLAAEDHNNHSIVIDNDQDGYTYAAYQIFSGNVTAGGQLEGKIAWGSAFDQQVSGAWVNSGAVYEAAIQALLNDLKTIKDESIPMDPLNPNAQYPFADTDTAEKVALKLTAYPAKDNPIAIAFGDVVSKHVKRAADTVATRSGNSYTMTGLSDGYYLVMNTALESGMEYSQYTRYILHVVADVHVAHKGSFPKVDKEIIGGVTTDGKTASGKGPASEAYIGEYVQYEIVGTLPNDIAFYDEYYYVFHDTLSKGLTYDKDSVKVTVNGKDVTKYFYKSDATPYTGTNAKYKDGHNIVIGIQDLLALENLTGENAVGEITRDTTVVLTYQAMLNEHALVGGYEGNPNKVYLEYDNNPNNDGNGTTNPPPENPDDEPTPDTNETTGITPEDEVTTFTTRLVVQKVDGTGHALEGAEFQLTSADKVFQTVVILKHEFVLDAAGTYYKLKDGTYTQQAPVADDPSTPANESTEGSYEQPDGTEMYKLTATPTVENHDPAIDYQVRAMVDENGMLAFVGLGAGTYTLTETKAPVGYENNIIDPITFDIEFEYDKMQGRYEFYADSSEFSRLGDANSLYIEIENLFGGTLPSTGGVGTTMFYIFGGIMFVGAAILLITKKRMGTI